MDYLTVEQFAELKGCSVSYISRLIKNDKITANKQFNPDTNKMSYMIPVSALPENLQLKWYKQKRTETGLLPEQHDKKAKKQKKASVTQRTFEELSTDEREEVIIWSDIVREWQSMRNAYQGSKIEFDKLYIGKCQLEHPSINVSTDILYRKWNAYRNNNIEGMIDKRGAWNKGCGRIPAPVWDAFLWYWLDENRPTVSLCYRNTITWTEKFYPELVHEIPTERSFYWPIVNKVDRKKSKNSFKLNGR